MYSYYGSVEDLLGVGDFEEADAELIAELGIDNL